YVVRIPGYPPIELDTVPTAISASDVRKHFGGLTQGFQYNPENPSCLNTNAATDMIEGFPYEAKPEAFEWSLGESFRIAQDVEITVNSSSFRDGMLAVEIAYRNSSGGYETQLEVSRYVVGDDGFVHPEYFAGPSLRLGPSQEQVY